MKVNKEYPDMLGRITITEGNLATVTMDEMTETVQLASDEEAKQLVAEFEDPDGEMGYAEGAVFTKYEQLHKFRP